VGLKLDLCPLKIPEGLEGPRDFCPAARNVAGMLAPSDRGLVTGLPPSQPHGIGAGAYRASPPGRSCIALCFPARCVRSGSLYRGVCRSRLSAGPCEDSMV
jgi:hypothetical protein